MISPKRQKVGLINLGCVRNLVDAQGILGRLKKQGARIVDARDADVVILNTCSFIEEAKRESIDAVLDLIELKKQGKVRKIIVAGCLSQRYGKILAREFKEVDAIVGVPAFSKKDVPPQVYLTPKHFAYVKICESCYHKCAFCVIPQIKGNFASRTIESVLSEIEELDGRGVKEINLIGQDITAYGLDLYGKKSLAGLLKRAVKTAKNIQWIRLLYMFPSHITDELLEVVAGEGKICKYLDVPLQHISDRLLSSMNRRITGRQTRQLVEKLRERIPQAALRTTFIVGLPGETEKDFKELISFVQETRFEKVGVFRYSREEGTAAYDMPQQVAESVKKKRFDILMREQQKISKAAQEKFLGKTLKVLIDEPCDSLTNGKRSKALDLLRDRQAKHLYAGRSEYDAPEVDGLVYVFSEKKLHPGDFVDVKVSDSYEYDLCSEAV